MRNGGKGDRKRPLVIPEEQFNANWDAIFGGKKDSVKKFKQEIQEAIKEIEEKIKNDNRD